MRRRTQPAAGRAGAPAGVILAGGEGRRIGGAKALVNLCSRPLICYPLEAMRQALGAVAVVAKIDTQLPSLPGVTVWVEPDEPRHPLAGIVHALAMAGGRAVVVCAVDLPFVSAELIERLARADAGGAPALLASGPDGRVQPLLGRYEPEALQLLGGARLTAPARPLRDLLAAIGARLYPVEDPDALFNVNHPDDLLRAAAMLDRRTAAEPGGSP